MTEINRCPWSETDELLKQYHDKEWAIPTYDDKEIFERLILELFQSGLSWLTILKKRDAFRLAFDNFDPEIVSKYDENKVIKLLENESIIRHEIKIRSTIINAQKFLEVQEKYGSFSKYIWSYVFDTPIINPWSSPDEVPSKNPLSDKICDDMKKMGFTFIGSKTIYSFLQSIGMINDHILSCDFKYED